MKNIPELNCLWCAVCVQVLAQINTTLFLCQVDYESEEENGEENVNENPEDEEAESEKEEGTPGAEEDQNRAEGEDSQNASFVSQTKKGKDRLLQSAEVRVSAVVESHPSIQDYTFDTENELWCEVRWNFCGWLHSGFM